MSTRAAGIPRPVLAALIVLIAFSGTAEAAKRHECARNCKQEGECEVCTITLCEKRRQRDGSWGDVIVGSKKQTRCPAPEVAAAAQYKLKMGTVVQGSAAPAAEPDAGAPQSPSASGRAAYGAQDDPASRASTSAGARVANQMYDANNDGVKACGPFSKEIPDTGGSGLVAPALAVYRGQLHLVSQYDPNCSARKIPGLNVLAMALCDDERYPLVHRTFEKGRWNDPTPIPDQRSKKGVGLAAFGNHLHMVHIGNESNQVWHSMYDGRRWTPNVKVPNQKSKKRPALATFDGRLYMLHLGDSSDDLWQSRYVPGRGWTRNVRIGMKSRFTPGLVEYRGRLHMLRTAYDSRQRLDRLVHASWDGREWRNHLVLPVLTNSAPALAFDAGTGEPWLELTSLRGGRLQHSLFSTQRGWFETRSLADLKSDSPAAVAFYDGCWHMVSAKKSDRLGVMAGELVHTTFGTADIHPTR